MYTPKEKTLRNKCGAGKAFIRGLGGLTLLVAVAGIVCPMPAQFITDASITLEEITFSFTDTEGGGGFQGTLPTTSFVPGGANVYEVPLFISTKTRFLTIDTTVSLSFKNTHPSANRSIQQGCRVVDESPEGGNEDLNGDGIPGLESLVTGAPLTAVGQQLTAMSGETVTITSAEARTEPGHRLVDRSTRLTYQCFVREFVPGEGNVERAVSNTIVVTQKMVTDDPGPGVCPTPTQGIELKADELPCDIDFSIWRIESNQAVQKEDKSIVQIADKRTMVRVFPQAENLPEGTTEFPQVAVNLKARVGGQVLEPAEGFTEMAVVPPADPDVLARVSLKTSGNFILPRAWTQAGNLSLTATVNLDSNGDVILPEAETVTANNTRQEDILFEPRKLLVIGYLEACFGICQDAVHRADRLLRKIFPVAESSGVAYIPFGEIGTSSLEPNAPDTLVALSKAAALLDSEIGIRFMVIWVPDFTLEGEDFAVAAPINLDLLRVMFLARGQVDFAEQIAARILKSGLGEACRAGSFDSSAIGLDTEVPLVKPSSDNHLTSPCGQEDQRWISAATYAALARLPLGKELSAAPSESRKGEFQSDEIWLLSGTVRSDGTGTLDPAYRVPAPQPVEADTSSGAFCVQASAQGGVLSQACFDANFSTNSERHFVTTLPYEPGTTRITLLREGVELASLAATTNLPAVTITTPLAGSTHDAAMPLTMAWTAMDADGDALAFSALYSPDGGETWVPLGIDLTESSLTFDPARIQGGENVMFRVLASDGFNTTTETIGPVNVVQTPAIEVDEPAEVGSAPAGELGVGEVSIQSTGTGPLVVESATSDNPAFQASANLPMQVPAGASRDLVVEFTPGMIGKDEGTLTLVSNAPGHPSLDVLVEATGLDPEQPILFIDAPAESLDFGERSLGTIAPALIPIINQGQADLNVTVTVEGEAFAREPDAMALMKGAPDAITLTGGEQVTISIVFVPSSLGEFTGRLLITSNDPTQPQIEIPLEGRGAAAQFISANSASFMPQGTAAPGSIAVGGGLDVATGVAVGGLPLPTELLGTRIEITDSGGTTHLAQLFFVSPAQINYLVPAETALGAAVVRVFSGAGGMLEGSLLLESVAPGIYTANGAGFGVAAGLWFKVANDGSVSQGFLFDIGTAAAVPFSLGEEGDQVFIIVFGTGLRGVTNPVTASVGGVQVGVQGPVDQGEFAGLDQANLGPLPPSLVGSGEVQIILVLDGEQTNPVTAVIQ
jgi:uncharacterized protein (TIGR03437 family)